MRDQKVNELRVDYLLKVMVEFIETNGIVCESTVEYDGTICDGYCLKEDINSVIMSGESNDR